jgi:hypothetical protein
MRYLVGFICVLALGLMGCGETTGTGGSGGGGGVVSCVDNVCPCSEAGIRAAIEAGGEDPYTFDCDGPTTVVTEEQINVDERVERVALDGLGLITLDGAESHRLFWVAPGATLVLRGFAVSGGSADRGGGIYNEGWLVLQDSRVQDSGAEDGGGIWSSGILSIVDSTVTDNTAVNGAGIWNSGRLQVDRSTLSGNFAWSESYTDDHGGGGIWNNGTLSLGDSLISDNNGEFGGGLLNRGYAQVDNTTVSGNSADAEGGGIVSAGRVLLRGSAVHGNAAEGTGGILSSGILDVLNSSISGNGSEHSVSNIENRSGLLTLTNSTVSDVESSGVMVSAGTIITRSCNLSLAVSRGYNIESPGDTCGFDEQTDQVNVTAEQLSLGPLQGNGGPTETHALLPGSVAIGVIPADMCEVYEDQRGFPRDSMCDVGAFEVQP